jgi:hypothetical protein
MTMETYIADQPYLFPRPGIKMQYCRGRLEGHALAWHMQWETEASTGKHERSWMDYRAAIHARFHNQFQQEAAYKAIMEVRYEGNIQDMITEYDTLNVKAGITGVAYRTMLMSQLPQQVFKQLSTMNPADKTDAELREIILNAGKNVEIWQATAKNFGMIKKTPKASGRVSETGSVQKTPFRKNSRFKKQTTYTPANQKGSVPRAFKSAEGKTYAQMIQGVPPEEEKRRRAAKECIRCAWPSGRKGAHGTMKCFQAVKVTSGTADFPKGYQKLKVGGFDQLEDIPIDEYEIESDEGKEGQVQTSDGDEITEDSSEDIANDWWNHTEDISE